MTKGSHPQGNVRDVLFIITKLINVTTPPCFNTPTGFKLTQVYVQKSDQSWHHSLTNLMLMADQQAALQHSFSRLKIINLHEQLNFPSTDAMHDFLRSENFRPAFEIYIAHCFSPHHSPSSKGMTLEAVRQRLFDGEGHGCIKYSTPFPQKEGWDQLDYAAHMMWQLYFINTREKSGFFFEKGFRYEEMMERLWALLMYAIAEWRGR